MSTLILSVNNFSSLILIYKYIGMVVALITEGRMRGWTCGARGAACFCSRTRAEIGNNRVAIMAGQDSVTEVYSCDEFSVRELHLSASFRYIELCGLNHGAL